MGTLYVALKIHDDENGFEEDQKYVKISIMMASARFFPQMQILGLTSFG